MCATESQISLGMILFPLHHLILLLPRSVSFNLAIKMSKTPRKSAASFSRNLSVVVPNSRNLSHLWRGAGLDEDEDDLLGLALADEEEGGKLKIEFEIPGVSSISPVNHKICFGMRISYINYDHFAR